MFFLQSHRKIEQSVKRQTNNCYFCLYTYPHVKTITQKKSREGGKSRKNLTFHHLGIHKYASLKYVCSLKLNSLKPW